MKTLKDIGEETLRLADNVHCISESPFYLRTNKKGKSEEHPNALIEDSIIRGSTLRRLARKWIKHLNKDYKIEGIELTGYPKDVLETWIKHFFNLEDK